MEKTNQRETRDFLNVESFSQLPFIRPAPVKEKAIIRLFGKEFGGEGGADSNVDTPQEDTNNTHVGEMKDNDSNSESSRKFECHYCCRNFPTSQALGGHQNAHKRERQQAKRLHLQSAMVHGSQVAADHSHLYGLINYPPGPAYSSWTSNYNNISSTPYGRYGSSNYSRSPINGSPLALWRIPPVHSSTPFRRDSHSSSTHQIPMFSSHHDHLKLSSISGSDSQNRLIWYESKAASMQDHVSLDLHL